MSNGKAMNKDAFFAELSKLSQHGNFIRDPKLILRSLMASDMFRLGLEIQCSTCTQSSWYSLEGLSYKIRCEKSLSTFSLPAHSPNEIKWSYRTNGPFSLPKQAFGAYPLLLTLRFFQRLLDGATTPLLSTELKSGSNSLEIDLICLFRESRIFNYTTEILFCECKGYSDFKKKDLDRMSFIAREFPGAVLVMSTLKQQLSQKEIKMLSTLANRGRRYWKADRPFNPLLILTGTELFADSGPPHCWKNSRGIQGTFAANHHVQRNLLQLCDATQQIYLNLKPWHQWLEDRWKRRSERRTARLAKAPS